MIELALAGRVPESSSKAWRKRSIAATAAVPFARMAALDASLVIMAEALDARIASSFSATTQLGRGARGDGGSPGGGSGLGRNGGTAES